VGYDRRSVLVVAHRQVQIGHHQSLPIDRSKLACIPELVNDKEAWDQFEDGLQDTKSFDEAIAWVKANQEIVEKLTIRAMINKFNMDISHANKTWRN
jgi:hypothetical protein